MVYSPIYTSVVGVQAKTGLSNTEVDLTSDDIVKATIEDAEKEVELLTGRSFTSANAVTEYFSFRDKDVINLSQTTLQLSHFPIQSITEFKQLDIDENAVDTYDTLTSVQVAAGTVYTDDYWLEVTNDPLTNTSVPDGKICLKTDSFTKGTNSAKVAYTYGYTSVPVPVRDLACCLAGIRCWLRFIGAGYNRLNSYSIPQQNVSKGDFYQRGMQNINLLTEEANRLLDRIGRKPRTLFFATGAPR